MSKSIAHTFKAALLAAMLASGLSACAAGGRAIPGETVGETFRKVMAQIDDQCRKEKKGPYLDPEDPEYLEKRRYTDCNILKLKPDDSLATAEGRHAHSLKLPAPHDEPKDVWRAGMTGEEYFQALCEAEAGEWVFRTVEGVEEVAVLRPAPALAIETPRELEIMEAPYEIQMMKHIHHEFLPPKGKYGILETFDEALKPVRIQSKGDYKLGRVMTDANFRIVPSSVIKARYGITWRGISRQQDRENGIIGGELIVLDIASNAVMAFKRTFSIGYFDPRYPDSRMLWWKHCKVGGGTGAEGRAYRFVKRALVPRVESESSMRQAGEGEKR